MNKRIKISTTWLYSLRKFSLDSKECRFTLQILCVAENENEDCSQLSYTIDPNSDITLMMNSTAKISSLSYYVPIGTISTTINSVFTIDLHCYEFDLTSIDFKYLNKKRYFTSNTFYGLSFMANYEIVGFKNPNNVPLNGIQGTCIDIPQCYFSSYGNLFVLQASKQLPINFDLSYVKVNISLGDKYRVFTLNPFDTNVYDSIYEIKTYPDSKYLNNLNLMGYREDALLSFKVKYSYGNNPFLIKSINDDVIQYAPISGDENGTTFFFPLKVYSQNDYKIYSQYGSIFKLNTTITSNIKQYKLETLPNNAITVDTVFFNNDNKFPLSTIHFSDTKIFQFAPIVISIAKGPKSTIEYPYGYSFGNKDGYIFNVSIIGLSISFNSPSITILPFGEKNDIIKTMPQIGVYDTSNSPKIINYEMKYLTGDVYLFKFYVKANYGFGYATSNTIQYYGQEILVEGDQYNFEIEIPLSTSLDSNFNIYDIYNGEIKFYSDNILSLSPNLLQYITPAYISDFDMLKFSNSSFLYNDIDVTDHRCFNSLFFNYSGVSRDQIFTIAVIDIAYLASTIVNSNLNFQKFHSVYDYNLQLFRIDFYIEANSPIGIFDYMFINAQTPYTSTFLDNQLRVVKSNMDYQGPVFKEIKKINDGIKIDGSNIVNNKVGWSMVIQDKSNGFDFGYIVIRGELDQHLFNISITRNDVKSGGNIFEGEYDITIPLSYPCISQQYIITEVKLFDKVKRLSLFSLYIADSGFSSVANPFLYYLNDTTINKVNVECALDPIASNDITPPVLKSFNVSKPVIDVGEINRNVTFTFVSEDLESGIKDHQYPIVYLTINNGQYIQCQSKILEITNTNATYSCTIELPVGFGYGYQNTIILSLYNLLNNNGIWRGFSTKELTDMDFPSTIKTTFSSEQPLLTRYESITEKGGDLFIGGRKLLNDSIAFITFKDGSNLQIKINYISNSIIKIPNVKGTPYPYQVYIRSSSSNIASNTITITPKVYDYYIHIEPEPTFPPTVTPVPTNKPQSCPGNPECGGPSNGKCIENQGCVCYSPWIGIDCLSQIIIIDQPTKNDTSPSTNITLPTIDNNNSTVTYKSLITLVSIREIDILGKVVYSKSFEKWQVKESEFDNSTFIYNTTLEINKENKVSTTVSINATLKWFIKDSTIRFANETLVMNPSTMKYTIEIGNYPFNNDLNQLQLVISASIQSNSSDKVCSVKEFGETTQGDNSNYIKIQIDNHSLYGRFIRRGVVDSNIRTISNVLLDKDMNPVTTSTSLQSYIGIQIPNYQDSIIIDPDFSVIIDSYKASSKSNSICSRKSNLSNSKIAGIVIGSTAFVAVIIISIIYHFRKNKKDANFKNNINQKMKQMNSTNINNNHL